MTISQMRISLAMLTLVLVVSACALPGQGASSSAPTADPALLSTMIVETVAAARTQTAAPPAATPEPGKTGTNLEKSADGSIKYADYDAGFEMVFPTGWLAVRPGTAEFLDTLMNEGAENPMLHDQMTTDKASYDADFDRLYSYPLRSDIKENVIFGFSKLTWDPEDQVLLDNNAMGKLVSSLEGQGGIPGFQASVAQLYTNGNDVPLIEISGPFALDDGQGGTTPFYATLIFFKPAPDSLARMTFTILQDYQEPISADVKSVIESIKLLGP